VWKGKKDNGASVAYSGRPDIGYDLGIYSYREKDEGEKYSI
jgi:hypothetical protein